MQDVRFRIQDKKEKRKIKKISHKATEDTKVKMFGICNTSTSKLVSILIKWLMANSLWLKKKIKLKEDIILSKMNFIQAGSNSQILVLCTFRISDFLTEDKIDY